MLSYGTASIIVDLGGRTFLKDGPRVPIDRTGVPTPSNLG